jgi:cupin 2 domain-containing protein
MTPTRNLFADLPDLQAGEFFQDLWRRGRVRIERILSGDSPNPVLYDQEQEEWVLLLEGRAVLELAGERIDLGPGDHLVIPAHTPHRVLETRPDPRCLWLAVHLYPPDHIIPET